MKNSAWEALWAKATEHPDMITQIESMEPMDASEVLDQRTVWGHMRHLATYREDGDPTPYLTRPYLTGQELINSSHSSAGFTVEHHGTYWEVSWWSNEFSSSFSVIGRGRTLREALDDAQNNQ